MSRLLRAITLYADELKNAGRILVGFSGGLDSSALLHWLYESFPAERHKLIALHVNHGLSANARDWEQFCQAECQRKRIPLKVFHAEIQLQPKESVEDKARRVRYGLFRQEVTHGDVLVVAHHLDDQLETFFLQAIRGAGVPGLASMGTKKTFGAGNLLRPWLNITKEDIKAFAKVHELNWVEDESNSDTRFDRNYLRAVVLPLIKDRWPNVAETVSRAAKHCASSDDISQWVAHQDLQHVKSQANNGLSVSKLLELPRERCENVLRYWIRSAGFKVPSTKKLGQIMSCVLPAKLDSQPLVEWLDAEVRRYRDGLFVMPKREQSPEGWSCDWLISESLYVPYVGKTYKMSDLQSGGVCLPSDCHSLRVRFREEGDTCRPKNRNISVSLKKLFQEYEIPPWQRQITPIFCLGEQIVYIDGIGACDLIKNSFH